jgi:hypothetical protein
MNMHFRIVVFTAGEESYAKHVLDAIDKNRVISERFYQDSCTVDSEGFYVKDLSRFGDLRRVIIVDNNPHAYSWQPDNAIGCTDFINDSEDRELAQIAKFMVAMKDVEDVRGKLGQWKHWGKLVSSTEPMGILRPSSYPPHRVHPLHRCQQQKRSSSTLLEDLDDMAPRKRRRTQIAIPKPHYCNFGGF